MVSRGGLRGKGQRFVQAEGWGERGGEKCRVCAGMSSEGRPHGERAGPDLEGGRTLHATLGGVDLTCGPPKGTEQMDERDTGLEAGRTGWRLPGVQQSGAKGLNSGDGGERREETRDLRNPLDLEQGDLVVG